MSCCCYAQEAAIKADQQAANLKLNEVKSTISQQKSAISDLENKRDKLQQQLKTDDLAIAKIAKNISFIQKDKNLTQQTLVQLSQQKQQLVAQQVQQETILAQQLRAAYSTGQHDYLKLMLNQEKPASIQRTTTYYQYLNSARIKEIEQFKHTIDELVLVTAQHQAQVEKLSQLEREHDDQKEILVKSKSARAATISALGEELMDNQQRLAQLLAQEQNLVAALALLAERAEREINAIGLSQLKRKLAWPVKGKIQHSFGSKKQDYLQWKGVLLSAPVGRQISTIHNGTVLFSDWLKGYGLVTVIDHGAGYMSLYAHNQTLLKSVGDRVETGEAIALVGQSGGQTQPGLYFEIRYQGEAVNPKLWCR